MGKEKKMSDVFLWSRGGAKEGGGKKNTSVKGGAKKGVRSFTGKASIFHPDSSETYGGESLHEKRGGGTKHVRGKTERSKRTTVSYRKTVSVREGGIGVNVTGQSGRENQGL